MVTRRDLFRLLGGAAASPVLKPLAALFPLSGKLDGQRFSVLVSGTLTPQQEWLARQHELFEYTNYLRRNIIMTKMCQPMSLPPRRGRTIQFYTYKLPEGSVETA